LANLAVHRALLNGSSIDKSALRYCVEMIVVASIASQLVLL
jgi:hypothetical protein